MNLKYRESFFLTCASLSVIFGATMINFVVTDPAQAFSIDFKNPGVINSDGTRITLQQLITRSPVEMALS